MREYINRDAANKILHIMYKASNSRNDSEHEHQYAVDAETDSTCTEPGVKKYKCSCGHSFSILKDLLPHEYVNYRCAVCNELDPTHNHSYSRSVINEPTCTSTGLAVLRCDECGDEYNEQIPEIPHEYINDVCSMCGIPLELQIAPSDGLSAWRSYTADDDTGKITLKVYQYNITNPDVIVYDSYTYNDIDYRTKFVNTAPTSSWNLFANSSNYIETITFNKGIDVSGVTSCAGMFYNLNGVTEINGLEFLDFKNVTSTQNMFYRCESLKRINLRCFRNAKLTNIYQMFTGCYSLEYFDGIEYLDLSQMTSLTIFYQTRIHSIDLSQSNMESITTVSSLFAGCSNLESVTFGTSGLITEANSMFNRCTNIEYLDLRPLNFKALRSAISMFNGCTKLKKILVSSDRWNQYITYASNMFTDCGVDHVTFEDGTTWAPTE